MLENIRKSIAKLMEGTTDKELTEIYAGVVQEIDTQEGEIKKLQDDHTALHKKYVDVILHYPATDKDPNLENGGNAPKSLDECMNAEIAKRK